MENCDIGAFYSRFFENAIDAMIIIKHGSIIECNSKTVDLFKCSREQIINHKPFPFFNDSQFDELDLEIQELKAGIPLRFEKKLYRCDHSLFDAEITYTKIEIQNDVFLLAVIRNFTEQKHIETYRKMGDEILRKLYEEFDLKDIMEQICSLFKSYTELDSIAIRLQKHNDYPYFAHLDFSTDFIQLENSLIEYSKDGTVCCDNNGEVNLECICGLVLSGKCNSSNSFFTDGGSYWTNDLTQKNNIPHCLNTRYQCFHHGYRSIALIPIRDRNKIVGLMQLNDKRKDRFSVSIIKELEEIALHVSTILIRKQAEVNLKESENYIDKIVHSVNDAIVTTNSKGIIIRWNYSAEKIFGYTEKEIIGKDLMVLMPPQYIEHHKKIFKQIELGSKDDIFSKTVEIHGLHKNGNEFPVELSLSKLEMAKSDYFAVIIRDITDRKQKEKAIIQLNEDLAKRVKERTFELDKTNERLSLEIKNEKQIDERLKKLLHSITDYSYYVKIENNIAIETIYGDGCLSVTGYSVAEFIQDKLLWFKIIYGDDQKLVNVHIRRLMRDKESSSIEHRIIHKDGNIRWIRNTYVPLIDEDSLIGYDGLIIDITPRKLMEQQILNSVIETEERERFHFSQELHDSLGPTLSASKMLIQLLKKQKDDSNRDDILKDIENSLDESIHTVREISFKLSPHILQNYGLYEALESFVRRVQESTEIAFDLNFDKRYRFDEKMETIVYRILCECMNNSIKHSKATKININIFCLNNRLFVEHVDNGIGFDIANKIAEHKGVGILNMQSRVNSINGNINIISGNNKGTTIKLQLKMFNN